MTLSIELFRPKKALFGPDSGAIVMVRPCGKEYGNKTYLGILVGDGTIGLINVGTGGNPQYEPYRNPMILIPETHSVVFGCESWWGEIKTEDQLKQITDEDIQNIWYVKALKQIAALEKRG